MKFYGSFINRMADNSAQSIEIKEGMGATEYRYSDREVYEVIKVKNQENVIIRQLDAKRTDKNGMSDSQDYEYSSNENNVVYELVLRKNGWHIKYDYTKEDVIKAANIFVDGGACNTFETAYSHCLMMSGLTSKQIERLENGKTIKRYRKISIKFNILDKYFDYTF